MLILTIYLDSVVRDEFSQRAWDIPAKVYARALSFSVGQSLTKADLVAELKMLGYRKAIKAVSSGEYENYQQTFVIHIRPFNFWDGRRAAKLIQLTIVKDKISSLKDFSSDQAINYFRLDPLLLGNFHFNQKNDLQDRQLVYLEDLPNDFISALLVTEDRQFYQHWGLSLKGIIRAFWSNLNQGEVRQGGSTLTQQLIKNHFLTSERSLWRKGREAIMAVLTEFHYDKKTILQAYINEVYLGQNANTAIHGFARASEFYFDQPLQKLELSQIALLIGMVKGPSFYNPRRHQQRAIKRRNLVLTQMFEQGLISQQSLVRAKSKTLMVVAKPPIKTSRVPAFMGLVKKELSSEYSALSLKKDGLKLFTSLDPVLQQKAEKSLSSQLNLLDQTKQLQGAVIVSDIVSGEIQAVVGDRNPNFVGFNRAIDAYRQTGSVIKPFVYLAALQRPEQFNLQSPIKDLSFSLTGSDGSLWTPKNYDQMEHGDSDGNIALAEGLINSYNLATARLAMTIGIDEVVDTIESLGFEREIAGFPSIALGSKEMSPLEVLTLYQSIANFGVSVKPQVLLAVQDQHGNLLNRYQKKSEQVVDSESAFIIRYLLTEITKRGTAKSLSWKIPNIDLAGKTGTTNDLRDSWYAGFDENKLAIVWLGNDNNQPTGLTGASGALQVWADLFKKLQISSVNLNAPSGVVFGYRKGGFFSRFSDCKNKSLLPFYQAEMPDGFEVCQ